MIQEALGEFKTTLGLKLSDDDAAGLSSLKEENDSLKCQLEAYKNEVDLVKQEHKNAMEDKDKQIKALQQALQGMQQVRQTLARSGFSNLSLKCEKSVLN